MFSSISWQVYLLIMTSAAAIYYLVIGAVFYKQELTDLLSGKTQMRSRLRNENAESQEPEPQYANPGPSVQNQLESKLGEIEALLRQAPSEIDKAGLITLVNSALVDYEGMSRDLDQRAISFYVPIKTKEICGVSLSAEELIESWNGFPAN